MDSTLLIVSIGRVLQIALSLFAVRVYTTYLSTAEVGNLYLINSMVAFFGLALINPVGMYINRRLHKWADDKTVINYFFVFNLFLIILSLFSIIIVSVLNNSFGIGSGINLKLLSIFIAFNVYFNTWNQTIIPSLNMLNYRRSFVLFTSVTLVVGLVLSVAIVKAIRPSAVLWLSGQLIAQAVMTIVAFVYFKKVTKTLFDFNFIKRIVSRENLDYLLGFALPLGITTLFMWVQNQSYRMIIDKYIGLEFLGMIGLGLGIATSIAAAVESLAQQVYYPIFYSGINTSDPVKRAEAWNKMAQLTIPIYLSVTLMVSCLAPYLVKILVNDKFSQVFIFVIYGSWIELFRMTTNILSGVAHSEMQTKSLIKAYFAGGLVASVGVYLGSKLENYQQIIPVILAISGFVTVAIMYMDMKKLMQISIGFDRIVNTMILSLPFAIALFLNTKSVTILGSVIIVFIFGIYFLSTQYLIYKRYSPLPELN